MVLLSISVHLSLRRSSALLSKSRPLWHGSQTWLLAQDLAPAALITKQGDAPPLGTVHSTVLKPSRGYYPSIRSSSPLSPSWDSRHPELQLKNPTLKHSSSSLGEEKPSIKVLFSLVAPDETARQAACIGEVLSPKDAQAQLPCYSAWSCPERCSRMMPSESTALPSQAVGKGLETTAQCTHPTLQQR